MRKHNIHRLALAGLVALGMSTSAFALDDETLDWVDTFAFDGRGSIL